jgi:hypothetical protein
LGGRKKHHKKHHSMKKHGKGWIDDLRRGVQSTFSGDLGPLMNEITNPNSRARQVISHLGGRRKHKVHHKVRHHKRR